MTCSHLCMDLDDAIIAADLTIPIPLRDKIEWNAHTANFTRTVRALHGAPVKDCVITHRAQELWREGIL